MQAYICYKQFAQNCDAADGLLAWVHGVRIFGCPIRVTGGNRGLRLYICAKDLEVAGPAFLGHDFSWSELEIMAQAKHGSKWQ